jgi:hypothetical protein
VWLRLFELLNIDLLIWRGFRTLQTRTGGSKPPIAAHILSQNTLVPNEVFQNTPAVNRTATWIWDASGWVKKF